MSVFMAKKLKETRNEAHLTQDEVANAQLFFHKKENDSNSLPSSFLCL